MDAIIMRGLSLNSEFTIFGLVYCLEDRSIKLF